MPLTRNGLDFFDTSVCPLFYFIFCLKNDISIKEKDNSTKKHNKKEKYKILIPSPTQQSCLRTFLCVQTFSKEKVLLDI